MIKQALMIINNLRRFYMDRMVLFIEDMQIFSNEILFILGSSGTGKTTLIEALGLMSKNPHDKGEIIFEPAIQNLKKDYSDIWTSDKDLSNFRANNLSFIFQENYMMDNISVGDNLILSHHLKGEQIPSSSSLKSKMSQLSLPEEKILSLPSQLSIGQKQRMSFLQATSKDFRIIFADEPTGNLDFLNSQNLMRYLRTALAANQSAVVVSHNLDLAAEFADRVAILNLEKSDGQLYGTLKKENVFTNPSISYLKLKATDIFQSDIDLLKNNRAQS